MKKKFHPSISEHDEAVEATAAAWLAQRDEGLTLTEAAEFARWQQADTSHAAAVARFEKTWTALRQLRDFRPEARAHPDRDLLAPSRQRKVVPFPALAAAAALALAAVWWWPRAAAENVAVAAYATTAGGYERVTLPDGSAMELNAGSEARVAFAPAERRVRLVRGEAHFTVAKNPLRPFVVRAGGVDFRAVGTAFDVRLAAESVELLVTEGRVEVVQVEPSIAPPPEPPVLAAGERMAISSGSAPRPALASALPRVEKLAPERIHEELAWLGPRLMFSETRLAEVVAEFNRLNKVQLELGDADLASLPVGGSFRADNVEAFVRLLATGNDIAVERPAQSRIVLRRAR